MTTTPAALAALREEFEAHLFKEWVGHRFPDRLPDGEYKNPGVEARWRSFQAGRASVAQAEPTTEDINRQDWAGMDGTTAYWLIERHGEDWAHCGRLMEAWRRAQAEPVTAAEPFNAPAFIQHAQSVANGRHTWADEWLLWYEPGKWLSEERACAAFLGGKLGAAAEWPTLRDVIDRMVNVSETTAAIRDRFGIEGK